ncbi:MAG: GNAT family N-acyltransferase [Pyrinomonadaceae bacterium]
MQEIQYKESVVSVPEMTELRKSLENSLLFERIPTEEISYGRYSVRYARTPAEVRSALDLQYEVFNLELKNDFIAPIFDEADEALLPINCVYLIVEEKESSRVVGTYRICTLEMARETENFFSAHEFLLEELPGQILSQSIEVSRLCILREHRNKQVLFLLWKFLARQLTGTGKRYLFGCCSIFSQDYREALLAFDKLKSENHLHQSLTVSPSPECLFTEEEKAAAVFNGELILPKLFGSYLKIGAKVCSEPAIDREFKTVDFFMIFDVQAMNEKYYRMFFT